MTLDLGPFEQTVGQINARFQGDASKDSWAITQEIIRDLGGSAVNVGGTNLAGDQPNWGLSSMTPAWLQRYNSQNYHLVDPFIAALLEGLPEVMTDCGTLPPSDPAYELNHDLKAHGYGSLYSTTSGNLPSGYRSIVVFCFHDTLAQLDAHIGFDRLKIIHAIIAANLPTNLPPSEDSAHINLGKASLSPRERDVLSWLACGLRNEQIAFKADIAEVTVRKHLTSIRRKLGASTREQAVAIAVRDGWVAL